MKRVLLYFNKFLDLIYKKRCYFCNSNKECVKMCSKCYEQLEFNQLCHNREISGIKIYTAGVYEKYLQKMIRGLKYHRQKDLAYYQAKFMWEYFSELIEKENLKKDYQVVPVPLFKDREKKRGYNHMTLVAEQFCKLSGFTLNSSLISRIKSTKPQYKLSKIQRMENLHNAFCADVSNLFDKPLLLIDDICTTGATFESMIKELKSHNINDIICFAAASPC